MPYGEGVPQLEDGFARIANEILDALARTSLTDYESRCIHYLWRKTYGWRDGAGNSKKDDIIAYSQWATGTSIDKRTVRRTLQALVQRQILTKKDIKRPGRNPLVIWGFQKRYQRWNGYNAIQLELGSPAPLLSEEVGGSEPPLDTQVRSSQPPVSYEVGAPVRKVGSPAPPEVGSPAPPTIDNKDTTTKDILLEKTEFEIKLLNILKNLKGWKLNEEEDLVWLREFITDYPGFNLLDFKACRDYYGERDPPKNKGPWKNRLRNWMTNKSKRDIRLAGREKGRLPTTEDLKQQAREKGVL